MSAERQRKRFPWKDLFAGLGITLVFFVLLEGALALFRVQPITTVEDPFVGFASDFPLFVVDEARGSDALMTAPNKTPFFNLQRFARQKSDSAARIFCLGGSTTYGRPYDDRTSFAGWLREFLPVADPSKDWEVINAGGISYASYRVAALLEELVRFDPDVIVVYSGHNEFLEERTYGAIRDYPEALRTVVGMLARTRTWAALSEMIGWFYPRGPSQQEERTILPDRVSAILDRAAGFELYSRDDQLKEQVLAHYELSLERVVGIARSRGIEIILATPAANTRDFSPFKSEHTDGLGLDDRTQSRELLSNAVQAAEDGQLNQALASLDQAIRVDPRHAELHFRRGQILFAQDRFEEAELAFSRALDEDVCPLRALPESRQIILEIAERHDVPVVDFVAILQNRLEASEGHRILGNEHFLDHVHPTIEGNQMLALAIIDEMTAQGIVTPSTHWNEAAVSNVAARVEAELDPDYHAQALAKLALTLNWAGKTEDSRRLAMRALEYGVEDPLIFYMVAKHSALEGRTEEAIKYLRLSLQEDLTQASAHQQMGFLLMGEESPEAAAAHFYMAHAFDDSDPQPLRYLGFAMAGRERFGLALRCYLEAQRLDPDHQSTHERIAALRSMGAKISTGVERVTNGVTSYPGGEIKTVSQVYAEGSGKYSIDGIGTQWYRDGSLKRYSEYENGSLDGIEIEWDAEGIVLIEREYRNGTLVAQSGRSEKS